MCRKLNEKVGGGEAKEKKGKGEGIGNGDIEIWLGGRILKPDNLSHIPVPSLTSWVTLSKLSVNISFLTHKSGIIGIRIEPISESYFKGYKHMYALIYFV